MLIDVPACYQNGTLYVIKLLLSSHNDFCYALIVSSGIMLYVSCFDNNKNRTPYLSRFPT